MELTFTVEDFKRWLKVNNRHLRGYRPDEIARIAMSCGFDIDHICGPVTDNMMHIKRLFAFWENPLAEKWLRVTEIQHGQEE